MSLYRKYRPQTFEDVVGQEHIAQTLRNALSAQPLRVAHAYLFCGPRGTGKTTSARLLAKCLNCEHGPTPTPCNECDFCTRVRDNQPVMDLIEIDAASHTGVDNVRETIIEKVNIAPAQGRYRVYIIDEVHMLSTSSFNALLKTLEEPPPHAIFILATTDAHRVPTTISSRCQRFDFRRVGPLDIVSRLDHVAARENIQLEPAAARLIAYTADGALRDALTLLEQVTAFSAETISESDVRLVLGTVSQELLLQIMDAVATGEAVSALQCIEQATEEGVSFSQLTRDLTGYSRDLLLLTVGFQSDGALTDEEKQRRQQHARQIGRSRLMQFVDALRTAEKEMRQSTDHRLLLELTLVRAASPVDTVSPAALPAAAVPARKVQATPAMAQDAQRTQVPEPAWRQPAPSASPNLQPTVVSPNEDLPVDAASAQAVTLDASTEESVSAEHSVEVIEASEVDVTTDTISAETMAPDEINAVEEPPVSALSVSSVRKGRRIHNFEEFVELWPKVLVRVKKKIGVTAVAYLHDAIPVGFSDTEAILEFQKEFHFEKACEAAKRLPFEQVVNETLAEPHVLKFRLKPPQKKKVEVVEEAPDDDDNDDDDDDVLKLAQDMFAGQVVGRSGQG